MVDLHSAISGITLIINDQNIPIKRQKLDFKKNKTQVYATQKKPTLNIKTQIGQMLNSRERYTMLSLITNINVK